MAGAPTLQADVAFSFSRRWGVEASVMKSGPDLRTSLTADSEGTPALAVVERVDQYLIEARVVIMLDEARIGQRTVPFAAAGAGYLRQLHEGHTVIDEGRVYHVGGGLKHWLLARDRGLLRAIGVRVDARLYLLMAGVAFDDNARPHGAISGSAFVAF